MSLNMRFDAAVFSGCAYLFRCSANVGKKWQQPPDSEKIRRNSSERPEEFLLAAGGDLHELTATSRLSDQVQCSGDE